MRERLESLTIEGTRIAARVRLPERTDAATVAVATALRLFARYPIIDRFTLAGDPADLDVTRGEADAWLAPDGLAAVDDPGSWPVLLARAVEAFRSKA